MANMKGTKRALIISFVSLFVCFTMLLGTTYAWFTDSVTSAGNIIATGTLDVTLEYKTPNPNDTDWQDASEGAIFNHNNWEPGFVQVRQVKIANKGTLDLKFMLTIVPNEEAVSGAANLADVIEVYMFAAGTTVTRDMLATTNAAYVGTMADLIAYPGGAASGVLYADDDDKAGNVSEEYVIALKMSETAGNEYQGLTLGGGFAVTLYAAQLGSEVDDLGNANGNYDDNATYGIVGAGSMIVDGSAGYDLVAKNNNPENGGPENIGFATVPKTAIDPNASVIGITVVETALDSSVTVVAGEEAKSYDITVTGLKANNDVPIKTGLYLGENLDPATVKLYHRDELIASTYNPNDGWVSFETTSYSPFTVVYDAESEYVQVGPYGPLPVAVVTNCPQHENVDLPWGSFGGFSPTEGLDSQLEAAYLFTCQDTPEQAEASPYAEWYCDFYVKLDQDLGENEIFLGGNYGDFGWVGFHNGELELDANTEIPLLGSVAGSWTYAEVANFVGEFTCGVGDVDDALEGATFTVMLRLTNPEDKTEFYNVSTINYTFTASATETETGNN